MKIVVLSAHTDDAEIGMGGTIINLLQDGHEVVICNMTSDQNTKKLGIESAKMLGITVKWLNFQINRVQDRESDFKRLERFLNRYKPDIIFTHWPVDEHPDHRATGSLGIRYVNNKQQDYIDKNGCVHPEKYCPQLLFYEVLIGKQTKCFIPDRYVEITQEVFKKKKSLMDIYASPLGPYAKSWYYHTILTMEFRGRESGACRHAEIDRGIWAEAFVSYPIPRGMREILLPFEK